MTPLPKLVAEYKSEWMAEFEQECRGLIKFGTPMEKCVPAKIREFVEQTQLACANDDGTHNFDCSMTKLAFDEEAP